MKLNDCSELKNAVTCDFSGKIDYKHLLAFIPCNPALPQCFLGRCSNCGNGELLKKNALQSLFIDAITYKAWVSNDRTTLETIIKPTEEFLDTFLEKLVMLKRHDFVAKQQALILKKNKNEIDGKVVIIRDFAENYTFVIQDCAQGYHWTNTQATIHPLFVYHKFPIPEDQSNSLKHISFVVISDSLQHLCTVSKMPFSTT